MTERKHSVGPITTGPITAEFDAEYPAVFSGVKKGELTLMVAGEGGRQSDATLLMQARYVLRDLHAKHPDAGYGKMAEAVERAAIKEEKGQ